MHDYGITMLAILNKVKESIMKVVKFLEDFFFDRFYENNWKCSKRTARDVSFLVSY